MFDGLQILSNSSKQGGQTVKCLVTKQCLMVFGHQTFLVCPGLNMLENYTEVQLSCHFSNPIHEVLLNCLILVVRQKGTQYLNWIFRTFKSQPLVYFLILNLKPFLTNR